MPQSSSITGAIIRMFNVICKTLVGGYSSAEMQSVYSTVPAYESRKVRMYTDWNKKVQIESLNKFIPSKGTCSYGLECRKAKLHFSLFFIRKYWINWRQPSPLSLCVHMRIYIYIYIYIWLGLVSLFNDVSTFLVLNNQSQPCRGIGIPFNP